MESAGTGERAPVPKLVHAHKRAKLELPVVVPYPTSPLGRGSGSMEAVVPTGDVKHAVLVHVFLNRLDQPQRARKTLRHGSRAVNDRQGVFPAPLGRQKNRRSGQAESTVSSK